MKSRIPRALLAAVATAALGLGTVQTVRAHHQATYRTVRVVMIPSARTGGIYRPAAISAHVGDHILFVNAGPVPHSVSADNDAFDSSTIGPGQSWTLVATTGGKFYFHCGYHPLMKGFLVVR